MKKAEEIVGLLIVKDHVERHPSFGKVLFKLLTNDLFALMGEEYDIKRVEQDKPHIKEVLNDISYLLSHEQIKSRHARKILDAAWETEYYSWDIGQYILQSGMFDEVGLSPVIDEVIVEQGKAWSDYLSGKDKVIGRLIGCVMKKTQGKADPEEAKKLFEEKRNAK